MESIAVPTHIHNLVLLTLKQYALVMDGMRKTATSEASRSQFTRTCRDIVDVTRLLEDCKS